MTAHHPPTAAPPPNPFQGAVYLTSGRDRRQLPPDRGIEVAIAGRSNAGKSSLINALVGQRDLARTSKTPGRTRLLNAFALDDDRRLVDLPGYGYARASQAEARAWQAGIPDYLERRQSLVGVVLVMDLRHPLTAGDRQLIDWLVVRDVPLHLVLTKADKLSRGRALAVLDRVSREVAGLGMEATLQLFSATRRLGLEELRAVLGDWLGLAADKKKPRKN